ncbi:hypothetical protein [Paeniglutamicibacter psychrophenolicus]|uniref:Heme/copper-type cytochrome/quinol oxidase subunit 1 n=1 Tax=Paeniglutamicibacter psychrophenolicus TaxID=257454 RepID=A0ABS4WFJ4_9MICC|nr:hypothetical protein [Paeniglutamicibacter psychrophenolicus]MBP2374961.1 heme/copper-type cytochrome/quinol oxidase subunit 1 [Paeniglutamicibacter psychrophenolicus]
MDDTTPRPQKPARAPRTRLPALAGILAALFLLAGILVFALGPREDASFGWFSYAPLSDTVFVPGMHFLTTAQILGWLLLALAACAATFWAGLKAGRRSR